MKIAVISDIHGNMEAFGRVLDDINQLRVKKIVCLGDMIGYGPEPEAVVQRIQALKIPTVMGNHELAVANPKILKYFNPLARRSLQLTAGMLSIDSMQYIRDLKPFVVLNGSRLVHGVPPDSITRYLFQLSDTELIKALDKYPEPVCFVGHTHMGEKITYDGHKITHQALPEGVTPLETGMRHIVNIGSIGQPRDDNNNAKYIIWDNRRNEINVRYIPYDIEAVARRIIAAGLPEEHAHRLRG